MKHRKVHAMWAWCIIALLSTTSGVNAQSKVVSLNLKNEPLKSLLGAIEKQTDYLFLFDEGLIEKVKSISVTADNVSTKEVLSKQLTPHGLSFSLEGKHIIIKKTEQAAATKTTASKVKLTGTVRDHLGEAVIGCNIVAGDGAIGTITDFDGHYTIEVPQNSEVQFSYIGYETYSHIASNSGEKNVMLREDGKALEELVVVGYGTQRKALVTHAIASFKPTDENMRQVLSPSELLQGRVAGVSVSTGSGNLGSSERMSIRGAGSISASNEPLYVIDGVPIVNNSASLFNMGESMSSLASLNLTDIESIEVLKDAASAAIYGSRGTNGVIVITTKSGKEGKSNLKVNLSTSAASFANKNRVKFANSDLYVAGYNQAVNNYNAQYGLAVGDKNYKMPISNPFQGLPDTDWLDQITQTGIGYNADVSFSGGNDKTKFYVSGNINHQTGIIKTNEITKVNLKSKISHKMFRWLEIGANVSGNYLNNKRVPGANVGSTIVARAVEQRPFDRPYKPNGDYYKGGTPELSRHNPVQILNEQEAYVDTYRFIGTFYAQFNITDKIRWKSSFNEDAGYTYDYVYYNENHPYGAGNGRIVEYNRLASNMIVENIVNYDDQFGDFGFGAMLGHSFQKTSVRTSMIDGRGFPSPAFDVIGVAAEIYGATGGISEYAMESYFGRVNASYLDRYILNATLRTDGSSRFAPDQRYGWFPSVSLGWNASNEDFWSNKATDLKMRMSYGKTGNQDGISNYSWRALMGGGQNYAQESGIAVTNFGNPNLTWETADQYDLGVDLGFWRGKFNLQADVYYKNTNNLLYSRPIHTTSGMSSIMSNVGSMINYGAELALNLHLNLGKVQWTSSFNIAHNRNRLTELIGDDLISIGSNRALKVGEALGSFYLFQMDGIYQYDGEVPTPQYNLGVRAGDVKWHDVDGNGIINDNDRVLTGSSNPLFNGGWNNSFKYKGFQLDLFFTYMYGNDVYAQWEIGSSKVGTKMSVLESHATNYWTGPGSTNTYPRAMADDTNNSMNSTRYLHDGSFIRLQSATFSYTFPQAWMKKIGLQSLRLFVQGDNLALFSNYGGWDPEVSTNLDPRYFGIDNYGVPRPRMFIGGLNLSL